MADAATKRVYVFRENARVVRNKQNDVQVSRMRDGRVLEAQPVCVPRVPVCHTETSVFDVVVSCERIFWHESEAQRLVTKKVSPKLPKRRCIKFECFMKA